jgi:hypothetical protein
VQCKTGSQIKRRCTVKRACSTAGAVRPSYRMVHILRCIGISSPKSYHAIVVRLSMPPLRLS